MTVDGVDLAVSTDAYVVSPLFFPGGDIGALAVHGTINDLAMRAAMPVALTVAYVLEEGFALDDLRRIAASVGAAATAAGVPVVTGDTKMVGRGAADGMYVVSTGIGRRLPDAVPSATGAQPGDAVLLSGPIGSHGTTILSVREGLGFEADISSDTQPLHRLVEAMLRVGGHALHALRDPTRGGIASGIRRMRDTRARPGTGGQRGLPRRVRGTGPGRRSPRGYALPAGRSQRCPHRHGPTR